MAVLLFVSAALSQPPSAERPAPAVREESPEPERDGAQPEQDPPTPEKGESELDTELLRRLLRERPGEGAAGENPLERAVLGMRTAHERIAGRDTGAETREIQQRVIDDLARLIELANQPPPPGQNNPDRQPSRQQNADSQTRPEQPDEPQPEDREDSQDGDPQSQARQSDEARESSEQERERAAREAELDRRRNLVDGVWGHLPPSVRNRILSGGGEEYLLDYEHLARRYFEALAEQSTRGR